SSSTADLGDINLALEIEPDDGIVFVPSGLVEKTLRHIFENASDSARRLDSQVRVEMQLKLRYAMNPDRIALHARNTNTVPRKHRGLGLDGLRRRLAGFDATLEHAILDGEDKWTFEVVATFRKWR